MPQNTLQSTQAATEISVETSGGVTTLRLCSSERRNSFTTAFMDALLSAVEAAAAEPSSRVILITGGSHSFSVGGDLGEFAAGEFAPAHLSVEESAAVLRRHARAVELLHSSPKISVAAIGGACAGAGLSLAAACDLRIASDAAVFRTAFVDAGLASDYGAIWSITRILGEARAKELFLLNPKVDAARALTLGLVSHVVAPEQLEGEAHNLTASLAAKAPLALATIKRLFSDTQVGFDTALDRESLAQKHCAYTEDAQEAARSFLERRAPEFSGK